MGGVFSFLISQLRLRGIRWGMCMGMLLIIHGMFVDKTGNTGEGLLREEKV